MAARATWKGYLKIAELAFPVSLYAAATQSKRISFHVLNRKTGNRVNREYYDEETGKAVERDNQVKGYETGDGEVIILKPEEIAAAVPENDKTIAIDTFISADNVDTLYFDRPYFIAPSKGILGESFSVLREGMRRGEVAALGRAVLFRRVRTVLLRAEGPGLVAHTLNFDYEVRSAADAFDDLPEIKIESEMLDLAKHIIATKAGKFDPREFDDRYDQALAELVKAKMEGREIKAPKRQPAPKVVSLMDALRESAKAGGKTKAAGTRKKSASAKSRKTSEAAQRRKAS